MTMTDQEAVKAFCVAWLAWVDDRARQPSYFERSWGLCANYKLWSHAKNASNNMDAMRDALKAEFENVRFPFCSEMVYEYHDENGSQHTVPARIEWARKKAGEIISE